MKIVCHFLFLLSMSICNGDLVKYLQADFGYAAKNDAIQNIDAIYLINLDKRKEKFAKCSEQLDPYNILPYRFSAVYGWGLPLETIRNIGVTYQPGMLQGKWVSHYSPEKKYQPEEVLLEKSFYGKKCLITGFAPGAIGCALSHLSVLQNAYDCGYETIWVLEDDISVQDDPHKLAEYILRLDELVGKDGWDILYTDMDTTDHIYDNLRNWDFISDYIGPNYFWRPDFEILDSEKFNKRKILSDDFLEIGSRLRAHSLIIRRSGIRKILDFEKKYDLFLPYDNEIHIVPDIKSVNLRHNLVTVNTQTSDTKLNYFDSKTTWENYKRETLQQVSKSLECINDLVAENLMDFIHEKKPNLCVEVGALRGAISYSIARAIQFNGSGTFYPIDFWDEPIASDGSQDQPVLQRPNSLNFEEIYQNLMKHANIDRFCLPLGKTAKDAVSYFTDDSIDLLYIGGNDNHLEEVKLYLPKVKEGGYICVNGADDSPKLDAIAYLMMNCRWMKKESLGNRSTLFQKLTSKSKKNDSLKKY